MGRFICFPSPATRFVALEVVATALATATVQACREACGGQGYLAANRLAALNADTDGRHRDMLSDPIAGTRRADTEGS